MTLKNHIKIQQKECLKHNVESDEFKHHWELLNYLCEISNLREENLKLIELAIDKGVLEVL
ncbi:MAG: hypothetical protein RR460_04295 [Clostridium sp.]